MERYTIVQLGTLDLYRIRKNYRTWLRGRVKSRWVRVFSGYEYGSDIFETNRLADARKRVAGLKQDDEERACRRAKLWNRVSL